MKILDIYDKNSDLKYKRKNIFERMDKFFLGFPKEYSDNYYKNLETLRIFRVDGFSDGVSTGQYDSLNNILYFQYIGSTAHELIHVASYDSDKKKMAFMDNALSYELGLMEGMTEYLSMKAFNTSEPKAYIFEVFCTEMLSNIEGLFKPYFIPNHDDFINLFPNEKDIYSLMYLVNFFYDNADAYINSLILGEEYFFTEEVMQQVIRDIINTLIDIELSFNKSDRDLIVYGEKFMDLISSRVVDDCLWDIYPKYKNYANRTVNRRIRSKIKR